MPRKNVREHRQKKNGYSAEAWAKRKQEINGDDEVKKYAQKEWRLGCLADRIKRLVFTKKNEAEAGMLDYTLILDINGVPVGLK